MSVIINNMDRPHNCYDCRLSAYYVDDECHGFCILTKCWMTKEDALKGVHIMCPLIPARGMSAEVKQAIVDAVEITDWYSLNRIGELVQGAESEETALYKAKDIYNAINNAEEKINSRVTEEDYNINYFSDFLQCPTKYSTKYIIGDAADEGSSNWYGEADGYADGEFVYDRWYCGACGHYFEEWDEEPSWDFCPICGEPMTEKGRRKRR